MVLHSFICSLYLSSLFRRSHASYTHSMNPRNKNKNKVNAVTLTAKTWRLHHREFLHLLWRATHEQAGQSKEETPMEETKNPESVDVKIE